MEPNVVLPLTSSLLSFVFALLARFGATEAFFLGELLGVVFLFAGFLVSIEVFRETRIPFTSIALHTRRSGA